MKKRIDLKQKKDSVCGTCIAARYAAPQRIAPRVKSPNVVHSEAFILERVNKDGTETVRTNLIDPEKGLNHGQSRAMETKK